MLQYGTLKYDTIRHKSIQCNMVQYSVILNKRKWQNALY